MKKFKKQNGFTLIETIIYIALFGFLIGSAFVTAYNIIEGSGKLNYKIINQEEANFVLRKLNWALMGIENIENPTIDSPTSSTLIIDKHDGNKITFQLNTGKIEIKESANGNIFLPITTENVTVSNLDFTYLKEQNGSPEGITATFNLGGNNFNITKYLRK